MTDQPYKIIVANMTTLRNAFPNQCFISNVFEFHPETPAKLEAKLIPFYTVTFAEWMRMQVPQVFDWNKEDK